MFYILSFNKNLMKQGDGYLLVRILAGFLKIYEKQLLVSQYQKFQRKKSMATGAKAVSMTKALKRLRMHNEFTSKMDACQGTRESIRRSRSAPILYHPYAMASAVKRFKNINIGEKEDELYWDFQRFRLRSKIEGQELQNIFNQFITKHQKRRFPEKVLGVQLNVKKDIIYIYTEEKHELEGWKFAMSNKYLSRCAVANIKVIPKPPAEELSCHNCSSSQCLSLSGGLDTSTKTWIGLGSILLAIPKDLWNKIPQNTAASFRTIQEVVKELDGDDFFRANWTVGANMVTKNDTQVIITSYHSLAHCQPSTELVFLTEVLLGNDTKVKVLSDVYVHKEATVAKESKVGYCKINECVDILVLEVHKDSVDLLGGKIIDACDSEKVEFFLQRIFEAPELDSVVRKRGAMSGMTYGKVIANQLFLNAGGGEEDIVPTFAVGSTHVPGHVGPIAFARQGDSGSLVIEKNNAEQNEGNSARFRAHGLVWKKDRAMNDETEELDCSATVCSNLHSNLTALQGGWYEDLEFPGIPASQVHGYNTEGMPIDVEGAQSNDA